jgi:hypothetical protein
MVVVANVVHHTLNYESSPATPLTHPCLENRGQTIQTNVRARALFSTHVFFLALLALSAVSKQ